MRSGGAGVQTWPTGWAVGLALLAALFALVVVGNRPAWQRVDQARQELARAGFPDAEVQRGQSPGNLSRCHVGQVRNRGYAYDWRTPSAHGVFCLPVDGRPTRIIVAGRT